MAFSNIVRVDCLSLNRTFCSILPSLSPLKPFPIIPIFPFISPLFYCSPLRSFFPIHTNEPLLDS